MFDRAERTRPQPPPPPKPSSRIAPPVYTSYTYEIYGNPTFADLEWRALPFAISQTGTIDRHKHTATSEGTLSFYVEARATKGFYQVSFRPSGANTGTP